LHAYAAKLALFSNERLAKLPDVYKLLNWIDLFGGSGNEVRALEPVLDLAH